MAQSVPQAKWRWNAKGRQYFFASIAVLLAAYFVNYSILYLLASFFFMILIYNYFYLRITLKNARVELLVPQELFAGQAQDWVLRLYNDKRWLPYPACSIWLGESFLNGEQFELLMVQPQSQAETSRRISLDHRGWFQMEGVRIKSAFPFGLIERECWLAYPFQVLVYPKPFDHNPRVSNHSMLISGLLPQNTGDFQYLKPYEIGDDVRLIHWKKSTLADSPVVRRDMVRREEVRPHVLIPDACRGFEQVVSLLTTWVLAGELGSSWQGWTEDGPHPFLTEVDALVWLACVQPIKNAEVLEMEGDQLLRFSELANGLNAGDFPH